MKTGVFISLIFLISCIISVIIVYNSVLVEFFLNKRLMSLPLEERIYATALLSLLETDDQAALVH